MKYKKKRKEKITKLKKKQKYKGLNKHYKSNAYNEAAQYI